jgi:pimeloyl-ACP methyl ester carboxylesterase
VDVVEDVRTVLAVLGWDRFVVWGGSGGAPHALALTAGLSDRITACASVVGLAPYDAPGLDWYAGMSAGNVEEFRAAAQSNCQDLWIDLGQAAVSMGGVKAG